MPPQRLPLQVNTSWALTLRSLWKWLEWLSTRFRCRFFRPLASKLWRILWLWTSFHAQISFFCGILDYPSGHKSSVYHNFISSGKLASWRIYSGYRHAVSSLRILSIHRSVSHRTTMAQIRQFEHSQVEGMRVYRNRNSLYYSTVANFSTRHSESFFFVCYHPTDQCIQRASLYFSTQLNLVEIYLTWPSVSDLFISSLTRLLWLTTLGDASHETQQGWRHQILMSSIRGFFTVTFTSKWIRDTCRKGTDGHASTMEIFKTNNSQ